MFKYKYSVGITTKDKAPIIRDLLQEGKSLEEIGDYFDLSRQRIYQIMSKYRIDSPMRKRKSFLKGKDPKYHWFAKNLRNKGFKSQDIIDIMGCTFVPDLCPILGIELNYDGSGEAPGWSRSDRSPSLDRIDNTKGYIKGNIHIISDRANRIKNDGTAEEHLAIGYYIKKLIDRS